MANLKDISVKLGGQFAQDLTSALDQAISSLSVKAQGIFAKQGWRDAWGVDQIEEAEEKLKDLSKQQDKLIKLQQQYGQGIKNVAKAYKKQLKIVKQLEEATKEAYRIALIEATKKIPLIGKLWSKTLEEMHKKNVAWGKALKKVLGDSAKSLVDTISSLLSIKNIFSAITGVVGIFIAMVAKFVDYLKQGYEKSVEWFNSLYAASGAMAQTMGITTDAMGAIRGEIVNLYISMSDYVNTFEDIANVQQTIMKNWRIMKIPPGLTKDIFIIGRATGLGAEKAAEFTRWIEIAYGAKSRAQRKKFFNELIADAKALNMPINMITEGYFEQRDLIARLGPEGYNAFKKMAIISKEFAINVEKIRSSMEQFDTLEGTIPLVARMNAIFGTTINALKVFATTDPAERFSLLVDELKSTGRSFEDMSYWQKKALANMLQLSEFELQAVFKEGKSINEIIKLREGEAAEQRKRIKIENQLADALLSTKQFMIDISRYFRAAMATMAQIFKPVINAVKEFYKSIAKGATEFLKNFGKGGSFRGLLSEFNETIIKWGEEIGKWLSKISETDIKDFIESVKIFFRHTKYFIEDAVNYIKDKAWPFFKDALEALPGWVDWAGKKLKWFTDSVIKPLASAIMWLAENWKLVFSTLAIAKLASVAIQLKSISGLLAGAGMTKMAGITGKVGMGMGVAGAVGGIATGAAFGGVAGGVGAAAGAGIGGTIGFLLGGTFGASLGMSLGSAAGGIIGPILGDMFKSTSALEKAQERLKEQTNKLKEAQEKLANLSRDLKTKQDSALDSAKDQLRQYGSYKETIKYLIDHTNKQTGAIKLSEEEYNKILPQLAELYSAGYLTKDMLNKLKSEEGLEGAVEGFSNLVKQLGAQEKAQRELVDIMREQILLQRADEKVIRQKIAAEDASIKSDLEMAKSTDEIVKIFPDLKETVDELIKSEEEKLRASPAMREGVKKMMIEEFKPIWGKLDPNKKIMLWNKREKELFGEIAERQLRTDKSALELLREKGRVMLESKKVEEETLRLKEENVKIGHYLNIQEQLKFKENAEIQKEYGAKILKYMSEAGISVEEATRRYTEISGAMQGGPEAFKPLKFQHGGLVLPNSIIATAAGTPYARTEGFAEYITPKPSPAAATTMMPSMTPQVITMKGDVYIDGRKLGEVIWKQISPTAV